jgi:HSP20 family protein
MNNNTCSNPNNAVSPWCGFQELESQLDRIFHGAAKPARSEGASWTPPVDIYETSDAYVLHADLPGLKREEIEVQLVENQITIRGNRKREEQVTEKGFRRYERAEGRFERNFRIKDGVDPAKVEAKFENGVLTVTLPKPEEAKPRQIEVKIS